MTERVYLYDSTLRDGAQTQGVDFTAADKLAIAAALDRLGIDYIEAGWPGANATDDATFAAKPALGHARLAAFGMTRKAGISAANDPGLAALRGSGARVVCLVGKTWDFHVDVALGVPREENLRMIAESVAEAARCADEVVFDAEHFFDGYRANSGYALACAEAARDAGARWVVLCDTNGGVLPHEVEAIVAEVARRIPGEKLGIHCHNDTDTAVANSLAAVRAGVRQVQGAFNGLGERCGNANLASVIPALVLKMGYETGVGEAGLAQLTHVSRLIDERLNRPPNPRAPYVGAAAFTHKGGLHVSAVAKDARSYEHIAPESVGNRRHIVVSEQAGRSNVLARLKEAGIELAPNDPSLSRLVELVKAREFLGYSYDGAEASFELLARHALGAVPEYFRLISFRVMDERRTGARGEPLTLSEATVKIMVGGAEHMTVAEGVGPVHALDVALRKALAGAFPSLADLRLVDYKVRILNSEDGTGARIRVMIDSTDGSGASWSTVGVSDNVIGASYDALHDGITYKLFRDAAHGGD
ncbi:MAG: citramalate synthase [Alphaproteobacteria bacterium]